MKDSNKHVFTFKDSEVKAMRMTNLLSNLGIQPIIKNEFQQALVSVFGANYDKSVELWVAEHQVAKALSIIDTENQQNTSK